MSRRGRRIGNERASSSDTLFASKLEVDVRLLDAHGSVREKREVVDEERREPARFFVERSVYNGFGLAAEVEGGPRLGSGGVSGQPFALLLSGPIAGVEA